MVRIGGMPCLLKYVIKIVLKRAEAEKTKHDPVSYPTANYAHSPQVVALMDLDAKPVQPYASEAFAPPSSDQVLAFVMTMHVRLAKIDWV